MKRPLITLLTDFGDRDHYVAAMKGVILSICPEANIVDITHGIPPFQIAAGAFSLAQAVSTFPRGAVHIAVVDPGVGTSRRAIAAQAAGHLYVAPDNGLLSMALESAARPRVVEISNQTLFRQPVSQTFHGRDIFAPVGAHLANGLALAQVGPSFPGWDTGDFRKPHQSGPGEWTGQILSIDRFGNVITNFAWADFAEIAHRPFCMKIGGRQIRITSSTYGDSPSGKLFILRGSSDYLEISVKEGDAAKLIKADASAAVTLSFR